MVIKFKQLLLRLGIVLAFLVLFIGILFLLPKRKRPSDAITLATEEARTSWLSLHGWRTGKPETAAAKMPSEWQTVSGQAWIKLQHAQGLSPEQCAGAEITRYIYPVYDGSHSDLYAELWLCGETLAGAVIYDAETQLMRPVLS